MCDQTICEILQKSAIVPLYISGNCCGKENPYILIN